MESDNFDMIKNGTLGSRYKGRTKQKVIKRNGKELICEQIVLTKQRDLCVVKTTKRANSKA